MDIEKAHLQMQESIKQLKLNDGGTNEDSLPIG
jgi:hypothetical protein